MIKLNNCKVVFEKFPNNETRIVHESIKLDNFAKHTIHFKFETDVDLIHLLMLKSHIDELDAGDTTLFIHYMPYSRMDRSENGSVFTLKYVARLINSLNFNRVFVVEPHSNVTTALLDRCTPYFVNFHLISEVLSIANMGSKDDYIMYPDAGAASRYKDLQCPNVIVGNKVRDFKTGKIKSLELLGSLLASGDKVLILDDLSSFGGTFIQSAKALRDIGFNEVYLLVAHAENSIFKGQLFDHVDKVFTTNSMFTEEEDIQILQNDKLHVFDLEMQINKYFKIGDIQ